MIKLQTFYHTRPVVDSFMTGKLAREERERMKISLRDVARWMRISAAYLSDLERGKRRWNEELVKKFNSAITLPRLLRLCSKLPNGPQIQSQLTQESETRDHISPISDKELKSLRDEVVKFKRRKP